jgi:hypothetical protein
MPFALMSNHNGRFHSVEKTIDNRKPHGSKTENFKEWLPDNHKFINVQWAGGWDEYIVDLNEIRFLTNEEKENLLNQRASGRGVNPLIDKNWLFGTFVKKLINEDQAVKIVKHLAGGD